MNNQHQPKQNYSNMQTSPYQQQPNYMNNSNPYGMPQGMGNPSAMPQNQNWQGGPSGYPSQPPTGMQPMMGGGMPSGGLPRERSYIENILRLNRGKNATVYMTFENNDQWNAEVFTGIIEEAGKDHIVLADPETGTWYLLLMIYLDYITFNEEIEYEYPFNG
ncbi:spore coat protein GerQ [Halalkalibacillus halophilus]|uniref:spore coat protein GerQ n=1 Tax=Halalkalibacillus halophilus TaxID=392827 RepID=UPI000A06C625